MRTLKQDLLNYNTHTTQQQTQSNKHTLQCESYPLQSSKRKGGGLHVPWRLVLTSSPVPVPRPPSSRARPATAPIDRAAAAAAAAGPARPGGRRASLRRAQPTARRAYPLVLSSRPATQSARVLRAWLRLEAEGRRSRA